MKKANIYLSLICLIGISVHAQTSREPEFVDGTTAYFHAMQLPASHQESKNVCELQSLEPVLTKDHNWECTKKIEMPINLQEQLTKHYKEATDKMLPEKRGAFSKQFLKINVPKWAKGISCASGLKKEIYEGAYDSYGALNDPYVPAVICKAKNTFKSLCPNGFTGQDECKRAGCPTGSVVGGDNMGDCTEAQDCCLKCEAGKIVYKTIQGNKITFCEVKNYKK